MIRGRMVGLIALALALASTGVRAQETQSDEAAAVEMGQSFDLGSGIGRALSGTGDPQADIPLWINEEKGIPYAGLESDSADGTLVSRKVPSPAIAGKKGPNGLCKGAAAVAMAPLRLAGVIVENDPTRYVGGIIGFAVMLAGWPSSVVAAAVGWAACRENDGKSAAAMDRRSQEMQGN